MSELTPILALPLLMAAQAQKHVTHNEALALLDVLTQLAVESFDATTPPASPAEGEVHALGSGATGAWAGHDAEIAAFAGGAWRFVVPRPGWRAWGLAETAFRIWNGTAWVGPLSTLAELGINTAADPGNRLAVASAATLFTHDGAGHQLKINKATATDTGSLLFQTGYSGRAELGLAGSDGVSLKVSADGSSWSEVLQADPGRVRVSDVLQLAPRASAPTSAAAGDIYFDSTSGKLRCHDGAAWNDLF